ncbi:MAG: riboflavin biosynthesis protein RibF [Paludibacter sp.]|nr:riboflavin biosynthesis protein RibF [Paludibacter sp.]
MCSNVTHLVQKYAATVGFFDGVHAGHRFLINELKKEAKKHGLLSMVITFKLHPRKVLHASYQPELLCSPEEKIQLLKATGVDQVIELNFSPEMAKLSAYEFMSQILADQLKVGLLLVGHDHRFGHNREDGFTEYVQYGKQTDIEVIQATRFTTATMNHISSSEIRTALKNGDIETANALLTTPYAFTGYVIDGFKVGRKIGFPTANLKPVNSDKLIPGTGVYAAMVEWNQKFYKAMMNIGRRPTLDNGTNISLEVHIIDFSEDIYHQEIKIQFLHKIRDEKKFDSVDQLILQLEKDKEYVVNNCRQ